MSKSPHRMRSAGLCALFLTAVAVSAQAQYNERPDLAGSGSPAVDTSGRSIKNKRVRAVHTRDSTLRGGTAHLFSRDPFLAYQLGRNLNFREFRLRDGVFSDTNVSGLGGPMPDGTTAKITANNQTSCSGCHNLPQGNPGGGVTFHKDSGLGRNSPHYYGAGLVEMLALQIRDEMLGQLDLDDNGWVSPAEADVVGEHCFVEAFNGGPMVDMGNPTLSGGDTGSPRLNNIFRVWYVDEQGRHVPDATEVDGQTTFGYNFNMIVWGWGQGPGRAALNPTNRAFLWDPWVAHGGLESYDPTTNRDRDGNGVSAPSLSGAIQFPATHQPPDQGTVLDNRGFSRDDPDGDGHLNEISEGDLDLAEWFMLNAPAPAFAGKTIEYVRGLWAMDSLGCTECHVSNWDIYAKDDTYDGDRRLFNFRTVWSEERQRLEGSVDKLYTKNRGRYVRHYDAFPVAGIFTDFRHHDMGEGFKEVDFGGNVNTIWRTPPLWGVGSGFPWGHDGQSLTLEHAILRHDGEGAASKAAWLAAPQVVRDTVLNMLRKMVLYDIESLPADIDGDGVISDHFMVAGMDTGVERFNAEWLFKTPLQIQGPFVNTDGVTITSFAGTNIDEAYGQNLRFRRDDDDDGWPNVWDHAPNQKGYKDGVN